MDTIPLDLRGLKCPLPVLRVRKALRGARAGSLLVVQCTDPMTVIDLPNLARETGDAIELQGMRTAPSSSIFARRPRQPRHARA